ncbi:MAG TPA: glycosyltransferase family 2 protein, partial [Caldisericia bacterium]|nr:glycosyltransferase family 2 protein [Caldisericia bacterium]
ILYSLALLAYLYSFVLFVRFFVWRFQANRDFWNRKVSISLEDLRFLAKREGVGLPFFTVMVPARNESLVIARTIENLTKLDYDMNSLEVIVVTDQKERQEHENFKPVLIGELHDLLSDPDFVPKEIKTSGFFLSYVVTKLPYGQIMFQCMDIAPKSDRALLRGKIERAIFEFCNTIISGRPADLSTVYYGLRRAMPGIEDERLSQAITEFLLLSRLAIGKLLERNPQYISALRRIEIISTMSGGLPPMRTENLRLAELDRLLYREEHPTIEKLGELYDSFFLTTQQVVEDCIVAGNGTGFRLKHSEVPFDFDGEMGGKCTGEPVKSTKGRALNWAFNDVDPQTDMVVFYDAESNPDHDVMLHAGRRLISKDPPEIMQGPLFQVRNYFRMGAISRIGGLYKAIAHDWYLPLLIKKLPFVGGTNLFISWKLIQKMRGFDENSLTEDLEFGCRAYLYFGTKLAFLPVKSTEQTPPTVAQFFRQRLRWGSGHMQVMRSIRSYPWRDTAVGTRKDFDQRALSLWWNLTLTGPLEWVVYQLSTLVVLAMDVILVLNAFGAGIPGAYFSQNPVLYWFLLCLNIPYTAFTFYCYIRYDEVFDKTFRPLSLGILVMDLAKLLMASFVVFLLPAPYTFAAILSLFGKSPKIWVKTPRTEE